MSNEDQWKRGVAFVKGMNMFDNARITKEKIWELCKEIEGEDLEIEKVYRAIMSGQGCWPSHTVAN